MVTGCFQKALHVAASLGDILLLCRSLRMRKVATSLSRATSSSFAAACKCGRLVRSSTLPPAQVADQRGPNVRPSVTRGLYHNFDESEAHVDAPMGAYLLMESFNQK
ncbi:unnamed protein product [Symbiodinium natans]|uniref:Uncharacterized protein n=1 Tax=Symbiodinium natans TaxID=878477 RepID=A0A812IEL3_9DINO|nr:unnamed protein product [Symbiodinium natans]